MKMKQVLSTAMIIVSLLTLGACAASDCSKKEELDGIKTDNYQVYLSSLTEEIICLREGVAVYSLNTEPVATQPSERTKTIQIQGTEHILNYKQSEFGLYDREYYTYTTADGMIQCKYSADTSRLFMLTLKEQDTTEFVSMSQERYEQWIRQFMGQFVNEDWSQLQAQHTTYIQYEVEKGRGVRAATGFVTEYAENESLYRRNFLYRKYIGDVATEDCIIASFNLHAGQFVFTFSQHMFDNCEIDLDREMINSAVMNFVNSNIVTSYSVQNIELGTGTLQCADDNYIYTCYVTAECLLNNEEHEFVFQVTVDIPDP